MWTTKEGVFFTAIMQDITERKMSEVSFRKDLEKSKSALEETVSLFVSNIEKTDPYLTGHHQRVAQLAWAIAKEMNLSEMQLDRIRLASMLHDIGNIYLPEGILKKSNKLTETEVMTMKRHPQIGYEILKTIKFLQPVAEIVLQHHERLNGSGYPSGLTGESILQEARVLIVADVVESMVSPRSHR
jgi:putative nucleotidyltransferase with HDIG domain